MKSILLKSCLSALLALLISYSHAQVQYHKGDYETIKKLVKDPIIIPNDYVSINLPTPKDSIEFQPGKYGIPQVINSNINKPKTNNNNSWFVKIQSFEAHSLDFVLSNLRIPSGSKMYIYNEDRTTVMGPIDQSVIGKDGKLATITFPGNTAYIQIFDSGSSESVTFKLLKVVHGIEPITSTQSAKSTPNISCIPDVNCHYGWDNEKEMIGRITVNGYWGTGTFMNNEALDRRPFFLTAYHVVDADGSNSLSPGEVAGISDAVILIDYRTTSCNSSSNSGVAYTGATFRAAWFETDFCLIELNTTPHINYLVNYAGWDRSGNTPTQGVSLHHPLGELMRFSSSTNGGVGQHAVYARYWQIRNWDIGVVAKGSSGCALFNQYHQVVGQLKSGLSNCTFMDLNDRYGKFSDSWLGGGTPDTQLKAWLSPNQNLGSMGHLLPTRMDGGGNVCYGTNTTVTMPYIKPGEWANWSVSGNLSIVSSTYNSVTVTGSYPSGSGLGSVIATFGSHQSSKYIYYGTPDVYTVKYDNGSPTSNYNYVSPNVSHTAYIDLTNAIASNIIGYVNWNPSTSIGYSFGQYFGSYNFTLSPGSVLTFNPLSASNQCGTSNRTLAFASPSTFTIYPNPAINELNVEFNNAEHLETLPDQIDLISEETGKTVRTNNIKELFKTKSLKEGKKVVIDVKDLAEGRYYLKVLDEKTNTLKRTETSRIMIMKK